MHDPSGFCLVDCIDFRGYNVERKLWCRLNEEDTNNSQLRSDQMLALRNWLSSGIFHALAQILCFCMAIIPFQQERRAGFFLTDNWDMLTPESHWGFPEEIKGLQPVTTGHPLPSYTENVCWWCAMGRLSPKFSSSREMEWWRRPPKYVAWLITHKKIHNGAWFRFLWRCHNCFIRCPQNGKPLGMNQTRTWGPEPSSFAWRAAPHLCATDMHPQPMTWLYFVIKLQKAAGKMSYFPAAPLSHRLCKTEKHIDLIPTQSDSWTVALKLAL